MTEADRDEALGELQRHLGGVDDRHVAAEALASARSMESAMSKPVPVQPMTKHSAPSSLTAATLPPPCGQAGLVQVHDAAPAPRTLARRSASP